MDISVIIVSYNVRYFLESCLHSVFRAMNTVSGEVIVVDNHSVDGSVAMVGEVFPAVRLIANKTNAGFAAANNQGIRIAKGRYILLLNPDTLIEETTIAKVVSFMENHPDAGALGVKMIDGKGKFLPESKRAVPTPAVAFFKVFGLARIFPRSGVFNRYALGHLDPDQIHQVEVLSGAFMMIRKETLEKTGGLDEDFFMYGEDIDLSYRILKAGYKNYYYSGTTIVHYKGESTKKGSLNYVLLFYRAMIKFAGKHFTPSKSSWLGFVIRPAIYFRAFISILRRVLLRIIYPLLDTLVFYLGYLILIPFWENYHFGGSYSYPDLYRYVVIPLYILFWIAGIGISGGYVRPVRIVRVVRGLLGATVGILILYALLPLSLRFSRALILLGAVWTLVAGTAYRLLLSLIPLPDLRLRRNRKKRILIVGNEEEYKRIRSFLEEMPFELKVTGFVNSKEENPVDDMLGTFHEIPDIIRIHDIHEVVFSAGAVTPEKIIATMVSLARHPVTFRVALPESSFILGSDSGGSAGELYLVGMNSVTLAENRLRKRLLDVFLALFFLVTFPLNRTLVKKPGRFMRNIFRVLSGRYSWVGFCPSGKSAGNSNSPSDKLKPGILCPSGKIKSSDGKSDVLTHKINLSYARNYHPWKDVRIVFGNFRELGS